MKSAIGAERKNKNMQGYKNLGKVKTIVIPLFLTEGISFEEYKEKTGIDLRDYFEFANGPEESVSYVIKFKKGFQNAEFKVQVIETPELIELGYVGGVYPLAFVDSFDLNNKYYISYLDNYFVADHKSIYCLGLIVRNSDNKIVVGEI